MLIADIRFVAGNIPGAIESYNKVIELQPESKPHLWQRGLALYYAEDFEEGKLQFESPPERSILKTLKMRFGICFALPRLTISKPRGKS